MKKAKTNKNILKIFCVIFSAVFALVTGFTFAAKSITLNYGINPSSTSAYLGNQQYHIVNDTINNPIPFGDGIHNFEIALQYAIEYDFDVRFTYVLKWNGTVTTLEESNVILQFANRDNIIYDENYIFLANPITKGNGKVTFITGVDFIDTTKTDYFGESLTIEITDVKIYKTQTSYALENHVLTKDIPRDISGDILSVAAKTWIHSKNKETSATSYVMMYNRRRDYNQGVPYPGSNSAYKKPVATKTEPKIENGNTAYYTAGYVYGAAWAGGNTSYAGAEMYVVSGTSALKLTIEVAGVWRTASGNDVEDKNIISENSIKFNYSKEWESVRWDNSYLWETRILKYEIPANTSCYINILDNIEIISADRLQAISYDQYRAVINEITINPNPDTNQTNGEITFAYYGAEAKGFISLGTVATNPHGDTIKSSIGYGVAHKDISIVNNSVYKQNLYEAGITGYQKESGTGKTSIVGAPAPKFTTNVSLTNNVGTAKSVTFTATLKYRVNNAVTNLRPDESSPRLETSVAGGMSQLNAFKSNGNYTYVAPVSLADIGSTITTSVVVAPYSSVNIVDNYAINASFQTSLLNTFDPADTQDDQRTQSDNRADLYDAWLYWDIELTNITDNSTNYGLNVETVQNGTNVSLYVKNNTNKIVKSATISNVAVATMKKITADDFKADDPTDDYFTGTSVPPRDWYASYWKYYTIENGVYTQLTAPVEITGIEPNDEFINSFPSGAKYYKLSHDYSSIGVETSSVVASEGFTKSNTKFTGANLTLLPGESVQFATLTVESGVKVRVVGSAKATDLTEINSMELVDNGKSTAYFINYSANLYYLRFNGSLSTGSNEMVYSASASDHYYVGIVRPGQIVPVKMTAKATTITKIEATGNFDVSKLSGWNETVKTKITNLFK